MLVFESKFFQTWPSYYYYYVDDDGADVNGGGDGQERRQESKRPLHQWIVTGYKYMYMYTRQPPYAERMPTDRLSRTRTSRTHTRVFRVPDLSDVKYVP